MITPTLTPEIETLLIQRAWDAREQSYSPYSRFKVGAAVLTADGSVYSGCNVESASFYSVCAEQTAAATAVAAGHRDLIAIAVVADSSSPASPCGGCRQFLAEFNPGLAVIYANRHTTRRTTIDTLLPDVFDQRFLPSADDE